MKQICLLLLALSMLFVLSSCGKYYKVKDPSTDKTYYTQKIKSQKGGAVVFEDGKTGSSVTIQNSEVSAISKEEYNTKIYADETEAKKTEAEKSDASTKTDD